MTPSYTGYALGWTDGRWNSPQGYRSDSSDRHPHQDFAPKSIILTLAGMVWAGQQSQPGYGAKLAEITNASGTNDSGRWERYLPKAS